MRKHVRSSSTLSFGRPLQNLAVWAVLSTAASGLAQSGTGMIQGTVTDPSGAQIPGASVAIVNNATHQVLNTVTNGAGFYSVPGLFAGSYTLTFTATGMKQYERLLDLQVAQTGVVSPAMTVGDVADKVTVTSNSVQLATYDSGTLSTQLDNARINQLPMNGRNILTLTGQVTPGLESGSRANGNMAAAIEYVQDGSPVTDRNNGGPATQVDPDSIQEVKIETSSSNAMYATPATAIVTTKSGTNTIHGSLFETIRNNAIGIARSRANPANYVAPPYKRNEFGASVGGPIYIPKLYNGRDRSFFFASFERYSLISGTYALGKVPTQAMRNGDFSNAVSGSNAITLYDPNTSGPSAHCAGAGGAASQYCRTAFANNQIPASRLSPLAKTLYQIMPLPTNAANPYVTANIAYPQTTNAIAPTFTIRLDHTFNQSNNAYIRYTRYQSNSSGFYGTTPEPATIAGGGIPANASNVVESLTDQHTAAIGFTHIFSPTFVSQTVLGNSWITTQSNLPPGGAGTNYEAQLGLPNNFSELGLPNIFGPMYQFAGTQIQWGGPQIVTNFDENLTKTVGRHQLFFGFRYRHERLGILPDRTADQVNFNGQGTALYNPASGASYTAVAATGSADADFYMGNAYYYSNRLNAPYEHWRNQEFDAYLQDDFHISDRLTANLGIRWEAHPAATERYNLINGFDTANNAVVLGSSVNTIVQQGFTTQPIITNLQNLGVRFETAGQAGYPSALVNSYNAIFDPRIGIAFSPFASGRGTVLRAGFGRYSYPIPLRNFYATAKTNEPFAGVYYQDYTSGAYSPDGQNNYILRAQQPVVAGQNSSGIINSSTINAITPGVSELALNPRYPPNMVYELNGTVEQPLRPDSVLRISYVWDRATNLDQQYNFNNPLSNYVWEVKTGTTPPGGTYASVAKNPYDNKTYGTLISSDRNGWSNYNALQVNYQRLFKHGYAYQANYTFGKTMRVGGNAFRDGTIYPAADYAPGTLASTDYNELNRMQNYALDTAIPAHHLKFNGIFDLPIGRGKSLFGKSPRWVNELIGGYQIAFSGQMVSSYVNVAGSATNWGGQNPVGGGQLNPITLYKHSKPITDCSSGVCYKGYLWFNGYISPLSISNPCNSNVVNGLPGDYKPHQTPINMDPGTIACTNGQAKASNANFLTNNVPVQLANGTTTTVAYSPGPAGLGRYSKTYLSGPFNWNADASLFKVFPLTEKTSLRVNVDAFNVFNMQGQPIPSGSSGLQEFTTSYWTPRQIQLTARLTF